MSTKEQAKERDLQDQVTELEKQLEQERKKVLALRKQLAPEHKRLEMEKREVMQQEQVRKERLHRQQQDLDCKAACDKILRDQIRDGGARLKKKDNSIVFCCGMAAFSMIIMMICAVVVVWQMYVFEVRAP
jgi:acetyl-CoA carboxylase alpha subunit